MFLITWNVSFLKDDGWFWLDIEQMDIGKPATCFFDFFGTFSQPHNSKPLYKLRRTWYRMARIAQIKFAHLQLDHHFLASHVRHSPNMTDTTDTSESETDTPFLTEAAVSSFSGSGIGWLTTDASRPIFSFVGCWFIYERRRWETETSFDGRALMGERNVNFLIRLLPDRYINGDADAYWRTQIDGDGYRWCLFQIPDLNFHLSIDWSINARGERRERYTSVGQQKTGRIYRKDIKDASAGLMVARTDRKKYQQYQLSTLISVNR